MTWLERPPKYSVLNCKRTPSLADQSREAAPGEPTRGHTQFASLTHTFESLSPALRQMLEGLNAVHANPGTNPNHASRHNTEIPPEQIHPCVRYHEGTGRKSLYINPVRNHAFRTPGVSWDGETVFGRPCHCLLALGSGLGLIRTASSRR